MKRSYPAAALRACALYAAFGGFSILVKLTRAHPVLVRRKLTLGSALLTAMALWGGCANPFSAQRSDMGNPATPATAGDGADTLIPIVTCYGAPIVRTIFLDDSLVQQGVVTIDRNTNPARPLSGSIDRTFQRPDTFSYAIVDSAGQQICAGNIAAEDGTIDSAHERFSIWVPATIEAGLYDLRLYTCDVNGQIAGSPGLAATYPLRLIGNLLITCYLRLPSGPEIEVDSTLLRNGVILLARKSGSTITAVARSYDGSIVTSPMSLRISDSRGTTVQIGDITPTDGSWDEARESFSIQLSPSVPDGSYTIDFFQSRADAQQTSYAFKSFALTVCQEEPLSVRPR